MPTVNTTRTINAHQLCEEIGETSLSLVAEEDGSTTVVCNKTGLTNAGLQTIVDAHVPVDTDGNAATLRERAETALADNKTFLAIASPTNAQTLAQVKALTRQNNGLIRLVLGKLDATD